MKKTAKNMDELNSMLMSEISKALYVTSEKVLAEMYNKTYRFYTKGNPKEYERTGALGDTPRTTIPTITGYIASFDAYLDISHKYTTGTFSMLKVLERAESTHFRAGILGKSKFWVDSNINMEKIFEKTMKKFFKKI